MPRGRPRKSNADPIEKDDSKWNKEDDEWVDRFLEDSPEKSEEKTGGIQELIEVLEKIDAEELYQYIKKLENEIQDLNKEIKVKEKHMAQFMAIYNMM